MSTRRFCDHCDFVIEDSDEWFEFSLYHHGGEHENETSGDVNPLIRLFGGGGRASYKVPSALCVNCARAVATHFGRAAFEQLMEILERRGQ